MRQGQHVVTWGWSPQPAFEEQIHPPHPQFTQSIPLSAEGAPRPPTTPVVVLEPEVPSPAFSPMPFPGPSCPEGGHFPATPVSTSAWCTDVRGASTGHLRPPERRPRKAHRIRVTVWSHTGLTPKGVPRSPMIPSMAGVQRKIWIRVLALPLNDLCDFWSSCFLVGKTGAVTGHPPGACLDH